MVSGSKGGRTRFESVIKFIKLIGPGVWRVMMLHSTRIVSQDEKCSILRLCNLET